MALSALDDKARRPDEKQVAKVLGDAYPLWMALMEFIEAAWTPVRGEWNFSGEKYGWSYRAKRKDRNIVYLIPGLGFFKAALVFGDRAVEAVERSGVSEPVKAELWAVRKYAEGRGIRLDVKNRRALADVRTLIGIKLAN